jgi:hypothetical protein
LVSCAKKNLASLFVAAGAFFSVHAKSKERTCIALTAELNSRKLFGRNFLFLFPSGFSEKFYFIFLPTYSTFCADVFLVHMVMVCMYAFHFRSA